LQSIVNVEFLPAAIAKAGVVFNVSVCLSVCLCMYQVVS